MRQNFPFLIKCHKQGGFPGGGEIGQKRFRRENLQGGSKAALYGTEIIDQRGDVEEDKKDIQGQARVGIILIAKFLDEGEGLEGKGKAQDEDQGYESDKGDPELERE